MTGTRSFVRAAASFLLISASVMACGGTASSTARPSTAASVSGPTAQAPDVTGPTDDSGAATQAAAGNAPDPCSLITDAEAATLFGGPATHKAGDSKDASNGNGVVVTENRCEYDEVKSSQLGYDLWVAVYAGADRAYFDDVSSPDDAPPIAGLGDAAKGTADNIYVISKGTVLELYGSLPTPDAFKQAVGVAISKL